jgi:hypothetical protein
VRAAAAKPSPKLLDAVEKARQAGAAAAEVLVRRRRLSPETVAERPYMAARVASGAEFKPETPLVEGPAPLQAESLFADDVGAVATPGEVAVGALVRAGDRGNIGRVVAMDGGVAKVHFVNRGEGTQATATLRSSDLTPISAADVGTGPKVLEGGKTVDELKAEFAATGRIQPFFLPDSALRDVPQIGRSGGGFGVPRNPVHRSEAVLLRTGMLALQPDMLSASYLKAVKYALYDDIHTLLLRSAIPVQRGDGLPHGYVYVRRPVGKSGQPERISYTDKTVGEFRENMDELLKKEDDLTPENLVTRTAADAETRDGHLLAIPEHMAKRATGEFLRSSTAIRWFLQKPVAVWRALVLNLRPAWLVNNIVGNHLLYAIKYAGPNGLSAYARAVKAVGKETDEFRKLMVDEFPEQIEGTFIQTQRPGRFTKAQNIASGGLAPLDRGTEGVLRRAATETELRKHPAVRARLKAMSGEKHALERAARQALKDDPLLARQVSDNVNRALGNFLDMSPTEQTVLRSLFPFYAWYKAIARVVFRMPIDTPGRTAILVKLGQIGADDTKAKLGELPSYLRGAIPFGDPRGDRATILNTQPVNPFTTATMIVKGLESLAAGKPGEIGQDVGGTVNPFITALAEAAFGVDVGTGAPIAGGRGGIVRSIGSNIGGGLPQTRLIQAVLGTLYQGTASKPTLYDRNTRDELLAYLGVPYRDLSLKRARDLAEQGR